VETKQQRRKESLKNIGRSPALWAAVAAVVLVVLLAVFRTEDTSTKLSLDRFEQMVRDGEVRTAVVANKTRVVTGKLENGEKYRVVFPQEYADELTVVLLDNKVETRGDNEDESALDSFLVNWLPLMLIVGVFLWYVMRLQSGGKASKFGTARARRQKGAPEVGFGDVAGADEAVDELREIQEFLSDPQRFAAIGAKIPRGVLLVGPPGTGKTLLAKAVAGEAGVPFFTISGSDFVEMFAGVGAARVRDLFRQAKAAAPAIVFVDEIDAVGRHRGTSLGGGHDEREQTLNQLLVEMDGFDSASGVILMAATNRPDILDPALLRPGRFDRHVVVDAPDLVGRKAILEVHSRNKPIGADVDLGMLARRTPGFTGADLANVVNEAALLCGRRRGDTIVMSDVQAAVDRVIAGPERKSRVMNERESEITAFHEAGHAVVGHFLEHTDPIHKVSIVARGRALGWTLSLPTEDRKTHSRAELCDRLAMLLGGRTAEELIFNDITTGAADDIDRATRLARAMVTEYGMSDAVGPQRLMTAEDDTYLGAAARPDYSQQVASLVDSEVRRLLDDAHQTARRTLDAQRSTLDALAAALIERETLDEDDLASIFATSTGG